MKTSNIILAAWATIATAVAVSQYCTEEVVTEGAVEVCTAVENGLPVCNRAQVSHPLTEEDWTKYNGVRINSRSDVAEWVQTVNAVPTPNEYSIRINVEGADTLIPVCPGLYELLQAAAYDNAELEIVLEYNPCQGAFTWRSEYDENCEDIVCGVYPDFPQSFWDWNL